MNDKSIDRLIRDADPYDADALDLRGADQALLEEIMKTSKPRGLRSRLVGAVAVAAALTAAVGVPAYLSQDDGRHGRTQVGPSPTQTTQIHYTAAALKAAERNPRLVITDPTWKVVDVNGFTTDEGGLTYQRQGADRWVKLFWQPVGVYEELLGATRHDYPQVRMPWRHGLISVFDRGTDVEAYVAPRQGDAAYARIIAPTEAELRGIIDHLERASVEDWLATLPAEVVTGQGQAAAVDKVLKGVPIPPGFDPADLPGLGTNTEYHLAVRVIDRVLCGWVKAYDDPATKQAAVDAVTSSRSWPVLQRMNAEGDYPEFVWDMGDQMKRDALLPGTRESLTCG